MDPQGAQGNFRWGGAGVGKVLQLVLCDGVCSAVKARQTEHQIWLLFVAYIIASLTGAELPKSLEGKLPSPRSQLGGLGSGG